jgi:hypothetical protein
VITKIAFSKDINPGKFAALEEQARRLGSVRTETWQRFGSVAGVGLGDRAVRDGWMKEGRTFPVGATPWKQTLLVEDHAQAFQAGAEPYP